MCIRDRRDTYQRALHPARVARIAKEFDERVANEPKISFRDGHYYVMDGQNTIAARKFLNGGEDLQIRCKVYFGMTEREEALLFAQQTGISERLSAGQKLSLIHINLSGAEVKAFLIALSHLPGAAELTANLPKSRDTP